MQEQVSDGRNGSTQTSVRTISDIPEHAIRAALFPFDRSGSASSALEFTWKAASIISHSAHYQALCSPYSRMITLEDSFAL
jgi:hypothetical protein